MKNILLFIWQAPQNIFGLMVHLFIKDTLALKYKGRRIYSVKNRNLNVCLGDYIFLNKRIVGRKSKQAHEYGHSVQSRFLGPLYLPIIGLFSGLHYQFGSSDKPYLDFWTERWAEKLGKKYFVNPK